MQRGDRLDVGGADAALRSAPGSACGTTVCAGSGVEAPGGAGAPLGSLSTVPISSGADGSRPFIAAIASTETPEEAASAPSVSPGRTL